MADGSAIEWTDATWNPVVGCSVVSPGCTHCYAMKLAGGRLRNHPSRAGLTQPSKAGPVWTGKVRLWEPWLTQPFEWKTPRRIFVCAHGDLFHEDVPDHWIDKVFAVMALTPQHTYQVLTKRAKGMREYFADRWQGTPARDIRMPDGQILHVPRGAETGRRDQVEEALRNIANERGMIDPDIDDQWNEKGQLKIARFDWPLPNVWLGVSAEDQARADERIPHLLATPAAKRFISAEPLLGAIDLAPWLGEEDGCGGCDDGPPPRCGRDDIPRDEQCPTKLAVFETHEREVEGQDHPDVWVTRTTLDWVIAGGESGTGARPSHPDWFRSLRDQCAAAKVPFFFKQWGSWGPLNTSPPKESHAIANDGTLYRTADLAYPDGARYGEAIRKDHHKASLHTIYPVGKKAAGAELDGKLHREFPT